MKTRIINITIVAVAVTFLLVLAFRVRIGSTADAVAVLRTSGMTCGSCSDRISDTLQSLKGVAVTEVDTAGGWVVVGYDTKRVTPEALAEKVTGAGFGSQLHQVLTAEQFRQITGRDIGKKASKMPGCCGTGGCGAGNKEKQS